ncbi:MAG: PfkB family carbohydrate kinase [Solirubrobacterales bacterium]
MTIDLVCADPAFVDLTFVGLDALPAPGEERHARDLLRSPGGAATVAIGAARLGLSAALASPLGDDADGRFVRDALAAEGVACTERTVARTPVTAVLPHDGERAMVTFDPDERATLQDVAAFAPRAVLTSITRLESVPDGVALYATAGDEEARAFAGAALPERVNGARALVVNAREARLLSGLDEVGAAALALAATVSRVVVTLGPDGALTAAGGAVERVVGVAVGDPVDTTGAGDLFAAAYIWSDLAGASPEHCLRWACLAAALSVRVPTAVAGAQSMKELAAAGAERGLTVPGQTTT